MTVTGAVDIGGTKIAVGCVDRQGAVIAREETPTAASDGFPKVMERVAAMLDRARKKAGIELDGIGIGCTGPVDPLTGEVGDVEFLPGWKGCNPVKALSSAFGVGAAMENDADAALLGEAEHGTGRGCDTLILVTVGTGIGGGILVNRRLYRGVDGAHPEIGHHVIDPSGPQCFCGAYGCWEVLARGPAIAERFRRGEPDHPRAADATAKIVCELARAGDEAARREIEREGRYLGIGIANLVTLYAPQAIVLGGSVMASADLFLPVVRDIVRRSCGLVPFEKIRLTTASLGADTPLVGAAMVWRQRQRNVGDVG
jgi:glucokinase